MRKIWLPFCLLAVSCGQAPLPSVRAGHLPPTSKDVLELLLAHSSLPLHQAAHCKLAGNELRDATIGSYMAGWLAEINNPNAKNWIVTESRPDTASRFGAVWIARVMVQHQDGSDEWGWGVRFAVSQSDGTAIPESFECLSAV